MFDILQYTSRVNFELVLSLVYQLREAEEENRRMFFESPTDSPKLPELPSLSKLPTCPSCPLTSSRTVTFSTFQMTFVCHTARATPLNTPSFQLTHAFANLAPYSHSLATYHDTLLPVFTRHTSIFNYQTRHFTGPSFSIVFIFIPAPVT